MRCLQTVLVVVLLTSGASAPPASAEGVACGADTSTERQLQVMLDQVMAVVQGPPIRVCIAAGRLPGGSHYRPGEGLLVLDRAQIVEFGTPKIRGGAHPKAFMETAWFYVLFHELSHYLQDAKWLSQPKSYEVDPLPWELQADCFAGWVFGGLRAKSAVGEQHVIYGEVMSWRLRDHYEGPKTHGWFRERSAAFRLGRGKAWDPWRGADPREVCAVGRLLRETGIRR